MERSLRNPYWIWYTLIFIIKYAVNLLHIIFSKHLEKYGNADITDIPSKGSRQKAHRLGVEVEAGLI